MYNFFLVTARTSQGIYPELPPTPPPALPSAPPADEAYGGSSDMSDSSSGSRGVVRPHSRSPFLRNVRARTEGEGPYSNTPPPPCNRGEHDVCVPPAWGERIPGSPVLCRCLLCHQDSCHHAVRCIQCMNAPGCCQCIWGYMRSRYNSGCPLCRHGDPCGENPLGENQKRQHPRRREELIRVVRRRGRGKRGVGGGLLCGIGRARGRGRPQEEDPLRDNRSRRGGGRRGGGRGRATTMEEEGEN